MKIWTLVANRCHVRIFSGARPSHQKQIHAFEFPKGRQKNSEILSDRPGRVKERFGPVRHSYSKENLPTRHAIKELSNLIGELLEKARLTKQVDFLILISPPQLLGEIRATLSPETKKIILATHPLDLFGKSEGELSARLPSLLQEANWPLEVA